MAGRVWLLTEENGLGLSGISGVLEGAPGPGESVGGDAIIRLGRGAGDSDPRLGQAREAWVWNEKANEVASLEAEEWERRLRREGFVASLPESAESGAPGGARRSGRRLRPERSLLPGVWGAGIGADRNAMESGFRVSVFGLGTALVVPSPIEFRRPLELERRLARASARALYVLGLDSGTVWWRVGRDGRLGAITDLSPWLVEEGEEWNLLLAEGLEAFALQWRKEALEPVRVRLGADPEFVLLSPEGKIVPASRYLPKRGSAGCDSMRVGGTIRWPLGELRPQPAEEPRELAASIRRLLSLAAERTSGAAVRFRAGAAPVRGMPLGGHLHVSGAALTGERLRALDNAVALPLRLLEPAEANRRRPRYGSLGDFRPKSHGGFEYRTPPSWLVSPLLARGTLALAKLAAEHSRQLAGNRPLDEDGMRDAFYEGDREKLLEGAERIYRSIQSTPAYARYREDVDPLFRAIREGRHWDEATDLRSKWRIPHVPVPDR
ncbi:hypothetical protein [Cohnella sp. AR92]|uniref:putative amidoligase domain-containing protein n=1 Tax=Cohnella sp. AR92 TaxID=648716 RepID=UPI000F8DEEBD|nr:hypothetical protein [Cohnella sp. AR92]RUS45782.1 hypothetical protein ELR57_18165 [Cohnella sp. AR92]